MIDERLRRMFRPSSITVVGASPDLATYGGQTVDILLAHGFPGRVVPVDPRRQPIAGLPTAPSVGAIEEAVDLAVIVVPAPAVLEVVRECAEAGVAGAAIFSAGFSEEDATGAALEAEVLAAPRTTPACACSARTARGSSICTPAVGATFSPAADFRRGLGRAITGKRHGGVRRAVPSASRCSAPGPRWGSASAESSAAATART